MTARSAACVDCGKTVLAKGEVGPIQKRCLGCYQLHRSKQHHDSYMRRKARKEARDKT